MDGLRDAKTQRFRRCGRRTPLDIRVSVPDVVLRFPKPVRKSWCNVSLNPPSGTERPLVLKPFLYFFPALALFAAGCATHDNSAGTSSPVVETVSGKEEDKRAADLVRVTEFHWDRSGTVP